MDKIGWKWQFIVGLVASIFFIILIVIGNIKDKPVLLGYMFLFGWLLWTTYSYIKMNNMYLKNIKELKEPAIKSYWKSYPDEKPDKFASYLCITIEDGMYGYQYEILEYNTIDCSWNNVHKRVIYWVELNNPPFIGIPV